VSALRIPSLILSFDFDAKTEKKRLTCKKSCQSKTSEFIFVYFASPLQLLPAQVCLNCLEKAAWLPGTGLQTTLEDSEKMMMV